MMNVLLNRIGLLVMSVAVFLSAPVKALERIGAYMAQDISATAFDQKTGRMYVALAHNNGGENIYYIERGSNVYTPLNLDRTPLSNAVGAQKFIAKNSKSSVMGLLPCNAGGNFIVGIYENHLFVFHEYDPAGFFKEVELKAADNNNIQQCEDDTDIRLTVGVINGVGYVFVYVYPDGGDVGDQYSCIHCYQVNLDTGAIDPVSFLGIDSASGVRLKDTLPIDGDDNFIFASGEWTDGSDTIVVKDMVIMPDGSLLLLLLTEFLEIDKAKSCTCLLRWDWFNGTIKIVAVTSQAQGDPAVAAAEFRLQGDAQTIFDGNAAARWSDGRAGNASAYACLAHGRYMRTAYGLDYLIANGGMQKGAFNTSILLGGALWALRYDSTENKIVKNLDGSNLEAGWTNNKNDLGAISIGNGDIIINAAFINGMQVADDMVYVNVDARRNADRNPGVYAARLLMNDNGVFVGSTPWERVLTSQEADDANGFDEVVFFHVDETTGDILAVVNTVPTAQPKKIVRTRWELPVGAAGDTDLVKRLNHDLADGCSAVLDLPTGTKGIANTTNKSVSLALFGGYEKVIIARTAEGRDYHTTVNAFNAAHQNYKEMNLPGAGRVHALAFSKNDTAATRGYFFAGTDQGLYVLVPDVGARAGIPTDNVSARSWAMDEAGALGGANVGWIPMALDIIKGVVMAMESNGSHLFVTELLLDERGIGSRLHRFTIEDSVDAMEASAILCAESGSGGIPDYAFFSGLSLYAPEDAQDPYGLIATQYGIFKSQLPLSHGNYTWGCVADDVVVSHLKSLKRLTDENMPALNPSFICSALDDDGQLTRERHGIVADNAVFMNDQSDGAPVTYAGVDAVSHDMLRLVVAANDHTLTNAHSMLYVSPFIRKIQGELNTDDDYIVSEQHRVEGLPDSSEVYWIENISGLGITLVATDKGIVRWG